MAKNVIASNDLKSYKKKYGKAYAKGKLISFSKKEIDSLYGKNLKNSTYIMDKNKKYVLIGDKYYEKPTHKKAILIGASLVVAGAVAGTTTYVLLNNRTYQCSVYTETDGSLLVSGNAVKVGQSYTGTIQVPVEKQVDKTLPYTIKEVKTGNKVLSLKESNSNGDDDNYYSFDRNNDVTGKIYIHRVEGPIKVVVELNDKTKATRVERVEITSKFDTVKLNSTTHISAKVYPEYASNTGVTWQVLSKDGTSNSSLASINRRGDLTAGSTKGTVQVIAVSNDTGVKSEPLLLNIGNFEEDNTGFNVHEIYGSLNVKVSKSDFASSVDSIDLKVEGRNIIALEPIYSYLHSSMEGAFEGLTNLKSITLPNTIYEITENCFKGCESLTEIVIPKSVRGINKNAFANCKNLKTVKFEYGSQLQAIEEGAFSGCVNLEEIGVVDEEGKFGETYELPEGIDSIGAGAFYNCSKATFVLGGDEETLKKTTFLESDKDGTKIPASEINSALLIKKGVELNFVKYDEIYAGLFVDGGAPDEGVVISGLKLAASSTTITNLVIPSHFIYSFDGDLGLYKINSIRNFSSMKTITNLDIPYTVTSIEANCFERCLYLKNVHIPGNVKYVYNYAFRNLPSLETLTIDEGVEKLGMYAFMNKIAVPVSKGEEPTYLSKVTLPSSVVQIDAWCFYGRSLDSVVFTGNTDEDGNKLDWYSTYDFSDLVSRHDLNKNGNEFAFQHFENSDKSDVNATMLTYNGNLNGGYAGYSFYKNVPHELTFERKDRTYQMHVFDRSEYIKSGVKYCYVLDFTRKETKDVNILNLVNFNDSDAITVSGISAYDETGKVNLTSKLPSLDLINEYGEIDLTNVTPKSNGEEGYDKIYLYLSYSVSNDKIRKSKEAAEQKEALEKLSEEEIFTPAFDIDDLKKDEEVDQDDTLDEGPYNFISGVTWSSGIINTDSQEDYESLHFYEDSYYWNNYIESTRLCVDAKKTITYKFDCAELAEYYGKSESIPYFYTYSVNLQYSSDDECYVDSVSAEYTTKDQKEGHGLDLNAKINNPTEIVLQELKDWRESEDPTPMPTSGIITIKITYSKKVSSPCKIYLHSNGDWARSKVEADDDNAALIENADFDDEDKNK